MKNIIYFLLIVLSINIYANERTKKTFILKLDIKNEGNETFSKRIDENDEGIFHSLFLLNSKNENPLTENFNEYDHVFRWEIRNLKTSISDFHLSDQNLLLFKSIINRNKLLSNSKLVLVYFVPEEIVDLTKSDQFYHIKCFVVMNNESSTNSIQNLSISAYTDSLLISQDRTIESPLLNKILLGYSINCTLKMTREVVFDQIHVNDIPYKEKNAIYGFGSSMDRNKFSAGFIDRKFKFSFEFLRTDKKNNEILMKNKIYPLKKSFEQYKGKQMCLYIGSILDPFQIYNPSKIPLIEQLLEVNKLLHTHTILMAPVKQNGDKYVFLINIQNSLGHFTGSIFSRTVELNIGESIRIDLKNSLPEYLVNENEELRVIVNPQNDYYNYVNEYAIITFEGF